MRLRKPSVPISALSFLTVGLFRHRQDVALTGMVFAVMVMLAPSADAVAVNTVVFSDQTYANANWNVVNSFQFNAALSGQQPTGGNPGSYRQVVLGVAQNVGFVGQLNNTFVYDPSVGGAITGITYNIDLETTNGAGAGYYALLLQNGNLYIDNGEGGNASPNTWLNENIVLNLTHFGQLTVVNNGVSYPFLSVNQSSKPDFSATGSPITFGYEVTAGGGGFFTSITGIDNDPITLTVTPVPEPATFWLFGIGLSGLAYVRRKRPALTQTSAS